MRQAPRRSPESLVTVVDVPTTLSRSWARLGGDLGRNAALETLRALVEHRVVELAPISLCLLHLETLHEEMLVLRGCERDLPRGLLALQPSVHPHTLLWMLFVGLQL